MLEDPANPSIAADSEQHDNALPFRPPHRDPEALGLSDEPAGEYDDEDDIDWDDPNLSSTLEASGRSATGALQVCSRASGSNPLRQACRARGRTRAGRTVLNQSVTATQLSISRAAALRGRAAV